MHFYHPKISQACKNEVKKCDTCQHYKQLGQGHGELSSREVTLLPWCDVAVDLIGPWLLQVGQYEIPFSALTIVDIVTNLCEITRIHNKTSAQVALQFTNTWLP